MKKKTYSELLRDPRWQKKRLEILEMNQWQCQNCGDENKTLNVHHGFYKKGAMPWEYPNCSLHCLCEDCHGEWHAAKKPLDELLGELPRYQLDMVMGYVAGMLMDDCPVFNVRINSDEMTIGIADYCHLNRLEVWSSVKESDMTIDGFALEELRKRKKDGPHSLPKA